ncbi:hypothetical protein BM221_009070 [Beauveria bassiana]|uniref:Uncharacterized protein n=1 Tax=Beauveria bassiana TaxID=176275 RepID=A0A2N6NC77_BEABA|nr:hypothetical protein BM221_009070 [Beauveria bassiana]
MKLSNDRSKMHYPNAACRRREGVMSKAVMSENFERQLARDLRHTRAYPWPRPKGNGCHQGAGRGTSAWVDAGSHRKSVTFQVDDHGDFCIELFEEQKPEHI